MSLSWVVIMVRTKEQMTQLLLIGVLKESAQCNEDIQIQVKSDEPR